jgi:hypothetical protein
MSNSPSIDRSDPLALYKDRHFSVLHLIRWLVPNPRLEGRAKDVADLYWGQTQALLDLLGDGPEMATALRKLRESKDCAVIQSLIDRDDVVLEAGARP